jgi:hypothetical protein
MVGEVRENRFCGNCSSHNPYEYPVRVFCLRRFAQDREPLVDTLWCCDDWERVSQACHCVRDALREKNGE